MLCNLQAVPRSSAVRPKGPGHATCSRELGQRQNGAAGSTPTAKAADAGTDATYIAKS